MENIDIIGRLIKMNRLIIFKLKTIFIPCQENDFRPKFLESRVLIWIVIVLFFLKLITVPFLLYFPKNSLFSDISKNILVELINKDRKGMGLAPLKENNILNQAASLKAQDMLLKDYFAHQSPEGQSPWYWLQLAGYNYQTAGENLAIGFLDSEEVYQAWLNSPSHKANLFNPAYQEIGIAVLKGNFKNNNTTLVVQYFGTPQKKSSILKVATKEVKKESTTSVSEAPVSQSSVSEIKNEKLIKGESLSNQTSESTSSLKELGEKASFNFLYFFSFKYSKILQKIIYGFLILIIVALIVNIFIRFDIQHRDLILKTLILILILGVFVLIDKEATIKLIPHNFDIN